MISLADIRARRDEIIAVGKRYGASDFRVIGSVARGEATETSDVDIIVKFDADRTLFDHGALLMDLTDLLGIKVDVISEGGLHGGWRDHLFQEAVPL